MHGPLHFKIAYWLALKTYCVFRIFQLVLWTSSSCQMRPSHSCPPQWFPQYRDGGVKESTWNATTYNILTQTPRVCFHKQDLLCSVLFIQTAYCHIYIYKEWNIRMKWTLWALPNAYEAESTSLFLFYHIFFCSQQQPLYWTFALFIICLIEFCYTCFCPQVACLENPRDGGAWWAAVYGVARSWTRLKWLST